MYPAVVHKVKSTITRYGAALVIEFELIDVDHDGVHVDGIFPAEITAGNKLGRLLRNCGMDLPETEDLDSDDVVGRRLGVVVRNKRGRTVEFPSVVDTYVIT